MIPIIALVVVIFVFIYIVAQRDARLTKSIDAFRTTDEYIEKELESNENSNQI